MKICVKCGGVCEDWENNIHSACLDKMIKENELAELIQKAIDALKDFGEKKK